jgi:hypothetical protein
MNLINGLPWINLEPFIDIDALAVQKAKIAAALAASHPFRYPSIVGAQGNLYDQSLVELGDYAKELIKDEEYEHRNLLKLLGSAPKIQLFCKYMYDVVSLNEAIHLRTSRGGNYFSKHLAEHCIDTPAFKFFNFLKVWLDAQNIFSEYGRFVFFVNEAGVHSIKHRDYPDGVSRKDNFIWLSLDGRKNFYVYDDVTEEHHYVTSRVALFDNSNWHGSDICQYTGWSLRIDGVFSPEFREKAGLKEYVNGE